MTTIAHSSYDQKRPRHTPVIRKVEYRVAFVQPQTADEERRGLHAHWRNKGAMVLYWRPQGHVLWRMKGYVSSEYLHGLLDPQQWDDFWSERKTGFIVECVGRKSLA